MKKIFALLMCLCLVVVCGCGGGDAPKKAEADAPKAEKSASRILVAYFSRTDDNYQVGVIEKGNTHILADMIAEKTGADLFEIKPVKAYPKEYKACTEVAKSEKEINARPEIVTPLPDLSKYDVIFLGYPIWWGDMPMAVYNFIEQENWQGKTVIPFCTHEGSGISGTEHYIADKTKAEVKPHFEIYGHEAQNERDKAKNGIEAWLKKLGY